MGRRLWRFCIVGQVVLVVALVVGLRFQGMMMSCAAFCSGIVLGGGTPRNQALPARCRELRWLCATVRARVFQDAMVSCAAYSSGIVSGGGTPEYQALPAPLSGTTSVGRNGFSPWLLVGRWYAPQPSGFNQRATTRN